MGEAPALLPGLLLRVLAVEALHPAPQAGLPALRKAREDPEDSQVSESIFFECERCGHRIRARRMDVAKRRCWRCWAVVKRRVRSPGAVDKLWITPDVACKSRARAVQVVQELVQVVQELVQVVQELVQEPVQEVQEPVQEVQEPCNNGNESCSPSSLSDSPSIPRVSTISVREGVEDEGDTEGGEGTAADLGLDADVSGNGVSKSVDSSSEKEPLLLKPPEVKRLLKDPELEDCIRRTRHVKLCLTPASKGFWDRLLEIFEPSEAVYVLDEVEKADLWLEANPGKRPKTERGMRQFIMNWIKKAESLGLRELAYREAIQRNNAKRR